MAFTSTIDVQGYIRTTIYHIERWRILLVIFLLPLLHFYSAHRLSIVQESFFVSTVTKVENCITERSSLLYLLQALQESVITHIHKGRIITCLAVVRSFYMAAHKLYEPGWQRTEAVVDDIKL